MDGATRQVGEVLPGGYRILDIRKGGMGVVYVCHQQATEQLYAVKTVHFDGSPEEIEQRVRLFRNEVHRWIRISRESRSDKIVTALSFDADENLLILEFIDGLPLNRIGGPDQPIHPRQALQWARDIAEGMQILHADFQMIHRDLKPQNVLVTRKGLVAKITDFGIVKVLKKGAVARTRIGTPVFMAPECFDARADFRADIYSFGATLGWMLTGSMAFAGRVEELPRGIRRFVSRCIEPRPEKRYSSFDEVLRKLDRIDANRLAVDESLYVRCPVHEFPRRAGSDPSSSVCPFCIEHRELLERTGQDPTTSEDTLLPLPGEARGPVPAPAPQVSPLLRARPLILVGILAALAGLVPFVWSRIPPPEDTGPVPREHGFPPLGTWGKTEPDRPRSSEDDPVENGQAEPGVDDASGEREVRAGEPCEEPQCDLLRVSATAFEKERDRLRGEGKDVVDWESRYCRRHSPWLCTRCGRREEGDFRPEYCGSCGTNQLVRD